MQALYDGWPCKDSQSNGVGRDKGDTQYWQEQPRSYPGYPDCVRQCSLEKNTQPPVPQLSTTVPSLIAVNAETVHGSGCGSVSVPVKDGHLRNESEKCENGSVEHINDAQERCTSGDLQHCSTSTAQHDFKGSPHHFHTYLTQNAQLPIAAVTEYEECDGYSDDCTASAAGGAAAAESRHFAAVCFALSNYAVDALRDVARMESHFQSLSEDDKEFLLEPIEARISKIKDSILTNQRFLDLMLLDQTAGHSPDSYLDVPASGPCEHHPEGEHSNVNQVAHEHPDSLNKGHPFSSGNHCHPEPLSHSLPQATCVDGHRISRQSSSSSHLGYPPRERAVTDQSFVEPNQDTLQSCQRESSSPIDSGNGDLARKCPSHISESVRVNNISKVRSTLRQFVRDWSDEGIDERDAAYGPLLDALERVLPLKPFIEKKGRIPRILCPGSGLGRLPFEVVRRGYGCQGNEFSFFMLLGSNLILNSHIAPKSCTLYPYCFSTSNRVNHNDHLTEVRIPDVSPVDFIQAGHDFSMCAGEFVEVYWDQEEQWDGILTSFFIDTAKNVLLYIRTIARLLPPGGMWANLGPLLYHFSEMPNEVSIELSWEEIRRAITRYFTITAERWCDAYYTTNPSSMMQVQYHCIHFVALRNEVKVTGVSNPVY